MRLSSYIVAFWHRKKLLNFFLYPFSLVFQFICYLRYFCYTQLLKQERFNVPVIIVGNISVGGTGKTPLVGFLAEFLKSQGYHPGIIMHGYASHLKKDEVKTVAATSHGSEVGDEALLMARKTSCPIVAGRQRTKAVSFLLSTFPEVDIILCDDGLQHYQLARDIEIAVIDGQRRFGNGMCLPAGPLRESPRRLKKVDFIVTNGTAHPGEWPMCVSLGRQVTNVRSPSRRDELNNFIEQKIHAIAGIGHPMKFFNMCRKEGIQVIEHPFPDHHQFVSSDLQFNDNYPILMTEKDAVKCQSFAGPNCWAAHLDVSVEKEFLDNLLRRIQSGQKATGHLSLPDLQATPPV